MFDDDSYKQFAIVRDVEPRRVTLHLFGDVDMSTVGELSEAIAEIATDGDSLLINLSKCRYFDSSGLAALVRARKVLGAQLTILVDPTSQIFRIMHLVGFDTLFNVVTELHTPPRDLGFPKCRIRPQRVIEQTIDEHIRPRSTHDLKRDHRSMLSAVAPACR